LALIITNPSQINIASPARPSPQTITKHTNHHKTHKAIIKHVASGVQLNRQKHKHKLTNTQTHKTQKKKQKNIVN